MKLSELGKGVMLIVEHRSGGDIDVMPVEDFLNSSYFLDYPSEPFLKVMIASEYAMEFNLSSVIESIGEGNTHEDWFEDVMNDIEKSVIDVKGLEETINAIFSKNLTYEGGEEIEIDITPEMLKLESWRIKE